MTGIRLACVLLLVAFTSLIWADPTKISLTYFGRGADSTSGRSELAAWGAWEREIDPVTGKRWGDLVEVTGVSTLNIEGSSIQVLKFAAGSGEDVIWTHPDSFYLFPVSAPSAQLPVARDLQLG